MQISIWKKGFGIGIIILFLGISVLPSINANVVNAKTDDTDIKNSTTQTTVIAKFIGLIYDLRHPSSDVISFRCILVYHWYFMNGKLFNKGFIKFNNDDPTSDFEYFHYSSKIGIVTFHLIFASFKWSAP